jgi:hypothetical protein
MNWRKDDPGERETPRGYHHGNLRATLVRAALELIVALRDSEQFAAALARAWDDGRSDEFIALPVSPFAKSIQADSSTV